MAGGAAGGAVFGPAGAIAGRLIGALAGSAIDRSLFATHRERSVEGPRLADLEVMASTEGAPIPRVYGRARLAGQVIWATNLDEVVSTTSQTTDTGGGGKGMGGGGSTVTTTETTYSYFANLAVGLCEGPIGTVLRVWADGRELDLTGIAMRIYCGDEAQTPDPLIVAKEGDAPAYRGLAYVVFERLPLANFGNRIPQLSFEISRPVGRLEKMVRAVTLIPGSTEFGYAPATVVQTLGPGQSAPENRHITYAPSDLIASLEDLHAVAPNLERVAIVVSWFGTDLRCGQCRVVPCVDSAIKQTYGAEWSVAGLDRTSARVVTMVDGRPAYGGTPTDQSVIDLIAELKARGLKVTLYPFLMMDIPIGNALADPWSGAASQPAYPWRGRITCDPAPGQAASPDGTATAAAQVDAFFTAGDDGWNYRNMVLHYASLSAAAGGVDAFLIGSELAALTRVRSASGVYPAVNALVALAADVKAIVGGGTAVTYGADWTEYGAHVVDGAAHEVRFPLDPLWASASIDAIGIDYYAPLADWRDNAGQLDRALTDNPYKVTYLAGGLNSGEAFDWYYADDAARAAQTRTPITDGLGKAWMFRQKDIWNFWSQPHYERVGGVELGTATAWVPQSKPIWLTEIGCPAVDKGANQPSVFPDPKSSESGLPYFSDGRRDDLIQRRFLEAVLGAFDPAFGADALNPTSSVYGGRMVAPDGIHVWTWDARPYPAFPSSTDAWSDARNWETGHWLTGRLGSTPMDALVAAIAADSGVTDVDTSDLGEGPDGYVVDRPMAPRDMLDPLALAFAFEAMEQDGVLRFVQRGGAPVIELNEDDLVLPDEGAPARLTRTQESDLPREVSIGYTDIGNDYQRGAAASRRLVGGSTRTAHADLAMVANDSEAERRAEIWLQDLWAGRESAEFALPPSRLALGLGDIVGLTVNGRRRLIELQEISDTESRGGRRLRNRSGSVRSGARRATPPRAGDAGDHRAGACAGARFAGAAIRAAAGAGTAGGVGRSLAGAGGGVEIERWPELCARGPGAGAVGDRRNVGRSPRRAHRALAQCKFPRAAFRRRAGLRFRQRIVLRRQRGGAAARRRRVGGDAIRQRRARGRKHLHVVVALARAGGQRVGDGRAAFGGRVFRAARSECGDDRQRARCAGTDAATARHCRRARLRRSGRARAHCDAARDGFDAADAGASAGAARRQRRDLHLDPPHAHRWRYLGGRGAARRGQRAIRGRYSLRRRCRAHAHGHGAGGALCRRR
jgi:hypothetical protein